MYVVGGFDGTRDLDLVDRSAPLCFLCLPMCLPSFFSLSGVKHEGGVQSVRCRKGSERQTKCSREGRVGERER